MERPIQTRRWPLGLLGMLALVGLIEATLARHPLRFTDTAGLSWRLGLEAIPREAERAEVACVGDSLIKIGLIPRVIEAGTGLKTYNFGMAQAPAPATYFLLRRLLESGGRPSAIVVDFKPSVLAGGPRFSLRHWQSVLNLRECLELAWDSRSPGMLFEILAGRTLPSYRDRLEIREAVRSAFLGQEAPTHATNRLALRNWGINRGAHVNSARTTYSGEVTPDQHKKLLSDHWKPHRINANYVDRILALAEASQVPVYWLIPPLPAQLQERRERSGVDEAYVAFARSMQAKHPMLTVIDGRHSGYDDSTFADHTHLNGRGSIAISRDLATILRDPADQPRWVALPRFLDRPGSFPIEDVDQSRTALEAVAIRR